MIGFQPASHVFTNSQTARSAFLSVGPSTKVDFALDSDYEFGTKGDAYAAYFTAPGEQASTLTDIWLAVTSFSGNWALTDGLINWEIRRGVTALSQNHTPGSEVLASGTIAITPADAGSWVRASGLSVSLPANDVFALVVFDADGNPENFVTMAYNVRESNGIMFASGGSFSTTNGFSTAGSQAAYPAVFAVKVDGIVYGGALYRATAALPSTTLMRGVRIRLPRTSPPMLIVAGWRAAVKPQGVGRLYVGETAIPNDTPAAEFSFADWTGGFSTHQIPGRSLYQNCPVLQPGQTYYLVWKPTAASTVIANKALSWKNVDSDLRRALFGILDCDMAHVVEVSGGASWDVSVDAGVNNWTMSWVPAIATRSTAFIG